MSQGARARRHPVLAISSATATRRACAATSWCPQSDDPARRVSRAGGVEREVQLHPHRAIERRDSDGRDGRENPILPPLCSAGAAAEGRPLPDGASMSRHAAADGAGRAAAGGSLPCDAVRAIAMSSEAATSRARRRARASPSQNARAARSSNGAMAFPRSRWRRMRRSRRMRTAAFTSAYRRRSSAMTDRVRAAAARPLRPGGTDARDLADSIDSGIDLLG